jgi:SAM-dependent methyltransferase
VDQAWSARRTSFGSAAAAYALGRPGYPIDALRWALPDGATRVLDLAAGTGKLTETLLELGLDIVAVEPLDEMRAQLPATVTAISGTAENIPLPDASVDAIVVGQAYHWFDPPRALPEMRRVLRTGGRIGLFWNTLDDSVPWVDTLAGIIEAEERASLIASAAPDPPYSSVDGLADPERRLFPHTIRYDVDRLDGYVVSRSQTILMDAGKRDEMLAKVRDVAPAAEFELPFVLVAWRGDRA